LLAVLLARLGLTGLTLLAELLLANLSLLTILLPHLLAELLLTHLSLLSLLSLHLVRIEHTQLLVRLFNHLAQLVKSLVRADQLLGLIEGIDRLLQSLLNLTVCLRLLLLGLLLQLV